MSAVHHWNGLGSDSNKRRGFKQRLLFKSFPGLLLKSGVGPLARYGDHQEIINRRPEQGRCHYSSRTQINAEDLNGTTIRVTFKQGLLFKSFPGPLLKSGLCVPWTDVSPTTLINVRLEQVYLPSGPRLKWPGDGPLFGLDLKQCRDQNVGAIRVTPLAIIYLRLGTFGQVRQWCKSFVICC